MSIAQISKIIELWANREEYFENPVQDYLNIDKQSIRVLVWEKKWNFIRQTPQNYWPAWSEWFILLNGYNCQARCQYCYLQSYFKSPDMVRFSNIDDFLEFLNNFIKQFKQKNPDQTLIFYDWDFKDSLGYYGLAQNIENINKLTNLFQNFSNTFLEIRTKNILPNFDLYQKLELSENLITSITFSPQDIIDKYELGASSFDARFGFANHIICRWGNIGIRIDPIVFDQNFDVSLGIYQNMIQKLNKINPKNIVNYSIGTLRLKNSLYKALKKRDSNIVNNLVSEKNFRRYPQELRTQIYTHFGNFLENNHVYICMDE